MTLRLVTAALFEVSGSKVTEVTVARLSTSTLPSAVALIVTIIRPWSDGERGFSRVLPKFGFGWKS